MKHRLFIINILLIIFSVALYSSEVSFKQFDVRNGLFNNQTRMVFSMPDHRILVYVEGMFSLYDGSRFQNLSYNHDKAAQVKSFLNTGYYFDSHNRLWIRNFHDLFAIDVNTYQILDAKAIIYESGIKEVIETFFIDADGNAWLLTSHDRLFFYDWKNKAELVTIMHSYLPEGNRPTICDITEIAGKHYIFYSDGMMRCWNRKSKCMLYERRIVDAKHGYRLKSMRWDDTHAIIRTDRGLICYDVIKCSSNVVVEDHSIFDWTKSKDGLWISSRSGISHFDNKLRAVSHYDHVTPYILPSTYNLQYFSNNKQTLKQYVSNEWQGITSDWQGGIWVCSFNDGLFYYSNCKNKPLAVRYSITNQLDSKSNRIVSMLIYDKHTIYINTDDGIYVFDTDRHSVVKTILKGVAGKSISKDSKGKVWISTIKDGLLCYNPADGRIDNFSKRNIPGIVGNFNFCFEVSPNKMLVCVHGNLFGMLYTDNDKFVAVNNVNTGIFQFRYIVCACRLDKGYLVGTQNGFFYYDSATNSINIDKVAALNANKYSNKCNCLFHDGKGHIWIGTQYGLLKYDVHAGTITRYAESYGLTNCCIQSLAQDSRGVMWISTAGGLAYFDEREHRAHFIIRNGDEDMPRGSFMERSVVLTHDNHLFMGSTDGFIDVATNIINSKKEPLVPKVMALKVIRNETNIGGVQQMSDLTSRICDGKVSLRYNENFVSIDVSALDYQSSQRTLYRYRLDAIDRGWISTDVGQGGLHISYAALPPGDYVLHAQTSTFGIYWSKELMLRIHIAPPYWASWWAIILYSLLFASVIVFGVNHYIFRRKVKLDRQREIDEQKERDRLNEMKFRFFTNISHEFRTPLTLIITPLQTLLESKGLPTEVNKTLTVIKRSAQQMNSLISQLLDFRSLENKGEQLQPTIVQLETIFDSIETSFRQMAYDRNITFEIHKEEIKHATFYLDVPKFQKIINNLLSNAFKFTADGGMITIDAHLILIDGVGRLLSSKDSKQRHIVVSVSDTGVGIKQNELKHIFERFYQAENKQHGVSLNTGSGIGLNIVKGYVDLFGGVIRVKSVVNKGTTFTIELPDLDDGQNYINVDEEENLEEREDDVQDNANTKVKLLVVEDNRDFREFMVDVLKDQYHVYAAADGEEALSTTRVVMPDIIISDIMMPKMDGYELCKAVKENIRLSHIPIVLLTAKNTDEGRTEGYQVGADSYITKPFNMTVLQACITMLLDQRKERLKEFEREQEINPQKLTITPIDEKFLKKAVECMEKNMMNSEYDVVAFSSDMAMERTTLYRKMVAVVGKTPLQFMHSIRMKRALQLVESGEHSVADIAVMVGYNSVKYFSQNFKKEYGKFPSQFSK